MLLLVRAVKSPDEVGAISHVPVPWLVWRHVTVGVVNVKASPAQMAEGAVILPTNGMSFTVICTA